MQSIPASQYVTSIPGVLTPGGNPLSPNAVFLTTSTAVPIGTAMQFPNATAVGNFFGFNSQEYFDAQAYFSGFINCTALPSAVWFYQYNSAAVAGYLRGGALAGVSLTELQALSGTITVVIDGVSHVSEAINLSSASSFTNAAALIQTALQGGTPSTTATVTFDNLRNAFVITSSTTGGSSTVAFPTTDSLTTGLLLTAAEGAVLSAGAVAATPAGAMNGVVAATQNWVTLHLVFDPDSGEAGGPIKLQFAQWISENTPAGLERFGYVAWDTDVTPFNESNDSACFAAQLATSAFSGTMPVWIPGLISGQGNKAAFAAGMIASINYQQPGGAITFDYKGQAGLTPDVTSATGAQNLEANGYNFYGLAANATQQWQFFQPGSMPGPWVWADDYWNQIWLNANLQAANMQLLTSVNKIPYNAQGYALVRGAFLPTITQALSNGVIVKGVVLSGSQIAAINTATGNPNAASIVQNLGWYLQITPATPTQRGSRSSPSITFYYTDGGSIQQITFSSVDVE